MKKTQLQLRIETAAFTQQSYDPSTYFFEPDLKRDRLFVKPNSLEQRSGITEEEVKSGSYEEVRPAIQARLAHMEYGEELCRIAQECRSRFMGGIIFRFRFVNLSLRNDRLIKKALKPVIKRNGGESAMMLMSFLGMERPMDRLLAYTITHPEYLGMPKS